MTPPSRHACSSGTIARTGAPECDQATAGDAVMASSAGCGGCAGNTETSTQADAARAAAANPRLRAVFMGTPDFAATILERVLQADFLQIVAVYTQPDRPAGRGKKLCSPPVKELALSRGIAVEQPLNFKQDSQGDAAVAALAGYAPDVLLVAAYGLILPQRVLAIPRLMPLNVHASLLPKYRGAAPIQRAIMQGEAVTGVTIMRMEAGLDTGPILMQRAVGIDMRDDSGKLHDELALEGAELLLMALQRLAAGNLPGIAQDEKRASYAQKLRKEDGLLDLSRPAKALHAHIRGVTPWPGASLVLHRDGQEDLAVQVEAGVFPLTAGLKLALDDRNVGWKRVPGAIFPGLVEKALLVACGSGAYAFTSFRPAGRKRMDATAFYNGYIAGSRNAIFTGQ